MYIVSPISNFGICFFTNHDTKHQGKNEDTLHAGSSGKRPSWQQFREVFTTNHVSMRHA